LSAYKLGKSDNKDDLLDACAYGEDVKNEYWDKIKLSTSRLIDSECAVVKNNTPF